MDVYKIGVSIALANGVSPVLAIISRDMLGLNSSIKQIEQGFGRWAVAAGGVAAILGGTAMLGAMGKLVEHGRELVHQQELMKISGLDNAQIAAATAKAYETSARVQTTTISENLKHLRELRYAFGNIDVAEQHLEEVSKANAILNSVKGAGTDQVWELVKSLEQKGETADPAEFSKYVDIMTQAVISSGGRVTPAQFFSAFKYGRTAMLGWDETFVGQYLPRLIQSMSSSGGSGGSGSGGPGNALMSAFAKVVQGQMPAKAAEEFARMGLAPGGISRLKGSSQTEITGGIAGANLFQHNPYEWVQSVLMPALAAHNITSQEDIISQVSKMFPVRTASQVIAEMGLQGRFHEGAASPFEKDAMLNRQAYINSPAFGELAARDPALIMQAFSAQWTSMLEALGSPLVQPAMEVMRTFTNMFTGIAQFAGGHPEAIKVIAEVVASIGVALVAIGGVALASLISIPAAIAGVVAALATLAALNWSAITSGLNAIASAISSFISSIGSFAKGILGIPGTGGGAPGVGPSHGPMFHQQGYITPYRPSQPVIVHTALQVDGKTWARQTSKVLAQYFEHPTSAPFFDGRRGFTSPDMQTIST